MKRSDTLSIRLLLWDYSILYAAEREVLPAVSLGWRTPARIEFCLDDDLPVGASHHEKLVIVDDGLAEKLEKLAGDRHRLSRIERRRELDDEFARSVAEVADPEAPFEIEQALGDGFGGRTQSLLKRRLAGVDWRGAAVTETRQQVSRR